MLFLFSPPYFFVYKYCKYIKADLASAALCATPLCVQGQSPDEGDAHAKKWQLKSGALFFPVIGSVNALCWRLGLLLLFSFSQGILSHLLLRDKSSGRGPWGECGRLLSAEGFL